MERVQLQLAEEGADAQRLDLLAGHLRRELLQLDVDDVTALPVGEAPEGSRAVDVVAVGGLLVNLGAARALKGVISAVRAWLARGGAARRSVRLEIDGDVLVLSDLSAADQDRLIGLFVVRHSAEAGEERWAAGEQP